MIDFIKFKITDEALIEKVWNNDNLLVYEGKSEKRFKDEIKELVIKSYKNLYFTKYQDRLEIKGSIHCYFNDEPHNANDFYISDCIDTIIEIKTIFNLDLNKCYLINLEYGINIKPNILVPELILNLIYHEKRPFNRPKNFDYKIAGNEAYKQIKAYDKSVQFPSLCNNTFRFEVKSKQSKYINSLDLFTLNDLAVTGTYNRLMEELIKEWDNVLLFDLSKNIDKKYLNTYFWEDILKNGSRNKFNNQKKRYYDKLGNNNLHSQIRKTLIQKMKFLKKVQIPSIY